MTMSNKQPPKPAKGHLSRRGGDQMGQKVLVLQGGGALGAYQAGVYQGLSEAGIEPDWVIGTSIGAINAALIAANKPADRLPRLQEFWRRISQDPPLLSANLTAFNSIFSNLTVLTQGISGFFRPNFEAIWGPHYQPRDGRPAFYDIEPLRATLMELIDLDSLNSGIMRATVGAVNVACGEMCYFDSRKMKLDLRHILASGALPPAFPAIEIDGQFYWDGGVYSNTPVEAVFDDIPRHDSTIFVVDLWQSHGALPRTLWEVMSRQKDIQYSSRELSHIVRQQQIHRLRHVIGELVNHLDGTGHDDPRIAELASYGCKTTMKLIRLIVPRLAREDHTKDIDFSLSGIAARWEAGRKCIGQVTDKKPWEQEVDPLAGVLLYEAN